jgi:hypothetical protein
MYKVKGEHPMKDIDEANKVVTKDKSLPPLETDMWQKIVYPAIKKLDSLSVDGWTAQTKLNPLEFMNSDDALATKFLEANPDIEGYGKAIHIAQTFHKERLERAMDITYPPKKSFFKSKPDTKEKGTSPAAAMLELLLLFCLVDFIKQDILSNYELPEQPTKKKGKK